MSLEQKSTTSEMFTLCISCKWNEALKYVKLHPKEATAFLYPGKRGSVPITALQTILANVKCRGDAPIELIQALLEASPNLAFERHIYSKNVPMHAVFYNPFFSATKRAQISQIIIQSSGAKAVMMKNKDGRTPLHTICSQHCNFEPLTFLLNAAPQVASWEDNDGNLPIHLACRSIKVPLKSIMILSKAHPKGIIHKNSEGMTPLDVAIETCRASGSLSTSSNVCSKARSLVNFLTNMKTDFEISTGGKAYKTIGNHQNLEERNDTETSKKQRRQDSKRKKAADLLAESDLAECASECRDDCEVSPKPTKKSKVDCLTPEVHPDDSEMRDTEESHGFWLWVELISPHILLSMKIEAS